MTDQSLRDRRETLVHHHVAVEMAGDVQAVLDTFARPRYELVATGVTLDGAAAVTQRVLGMAEAMPGAKMELASLRHCDDAVIVETVTRGLHTGPLMGMPPTGKPYVTRGIAIFRFEGDDLVEEIVYFDRLSLMEQLRPDEAVS